MPTTAPRPTLMQRLLRRGAAPACGDDGDMGTAFGMELSLGAPLPPRPAPGAGLPAPWYRRWLRRHSD